MFLPFLALSNLHWTHWVFRLARPQRDFTGESRAEGCAEGFLGSKIPLSPEFEERNLPCAGDVSGSERCREVNIRCKSHKHIMPEGVLGEL